MEPQLPDYLINAQQGAQNAARAAGQLGSIGGSITDALNQSIQDAYNNNQDIIKGLDTATAGYFQAPSEARVKFQDIWNPFQRENLVSQYTTNQSIPMLSYSSLYGQRMGRAGDLLNAGVGAYESDVAARQAAADLAQQTYENALTQYQLEEDKRRWEIEQGAANQPSMLEMLLQQILQGGETGETGDDFEPETPSQPTSQYNAPINTTPNLANTGNATAYTPAPNTIYNAGKPSPFSGIGIDLGSAPQAPQQRQGFMNWLRGLF
jgi:type II secretory pathway pseudopilin PulG